jgi:hypothetical protein
MSPPVPEPPSSPSAVVTSARWEAPQPVADAGERPFRRCSPYSQSLCRLFSEQTAPAVAANVRGQVVALWQRFEGDGYHLVAARTATGAGWSEAERVTPETGIELQQVVVDGGGNAVASWFGSGRTLTSYGPAAGGWSAPQAVEGVSQLVMDDGGAAHILFTRWREGLFWSRLPPGGAWTPPVSIQAEGPRSQPFITDPRLAVSRSGAAHAIWLRRFQSTVRSEEWDEVWSSRMPRGQGWTPPTLLARFPAANALSPALAVTDSGSLASYRLIERVPDGFDSRRIMEQHLSGAPSATPAWTPPDAVSEPVPPPPTLRVAATPAAAADARGVLTLAWTETTVAPAEPFRYEIRARRFSAAQGTWEHAQVIASEQGYLHDRFGLHVAASAAGNAVVLWVEDSSGVGFRLWASVFLPASGWSAPTVLRDVDLLSEPSLAMDGMGNALVMWSEPEGDRTLIWSARLAAVTAPAR